MHLTDAQRRFLAALQGDTLTDRRIGPALEDKGLCIQTSEGVWTLTPSGHYWRGEAARIEAAAAQRRFRR